MLEDKLRATDWEATNELIEEQVARESYLQWFKDNERHKRNMVSFFFQLCENYLQCHVSLSTWISFVMQTNSTSPMRASSSSTVTSPPKTYDCSEASGSSKPHTSVAVPQAVQSCSTNDFHINEHATFLNEFPPECFGTW